MRADESGSITIDRSRASVWRHLTTLAELTLWYDDWDGVEHDPAEARLAEGLTFRLHSRRALRRTAECRVVTVDEPALVRWVERLPLRAPVLVEFRLTASTEQRTVVTHVKTVGRLRRSGSVPGLRRSPDTVTS